MKRVLLVRIGWMKYYAGSKAGDDRPIGGGEYNEGNLGSEVHAFKNINNWLHASFAIGSKDQRLDLSRIDPDVTSEVVDNVKVIFFATDPRPNSLGQVVVGWYEKAKLYDRFRKKPVRHLAACKTSEGVLVPSAKRVFVIPRGKNAPGQSNVFFAYDRDGNRRDLKWLREVMAYTEKYRGPNLLKNPGAEAEPDIELARENVLATSLGQGVVIDTSTRKVIENIAMNAARKYFHGLGYKVKDVSSRESYDLECFKDKKKLLVEVKGTQAVLSSITLTPNEVKLARKGDNMVLFIRHSIKVSGNGKRVSARGGEDKVIKPWKIDGKRLRAIAYSYQVA